MGGFRAMIDRQLKPQNTIIMLTNRGDSFAVREITSAIRNILNDKVFELPVR